jgi:hypothetical protein
VHRRGGENVFTANGGNADVSAGSTDVNDGEIHHVALVSDPDGGEVRFYVDGELEGTSGAPSIESNDNPMMIGENPDARGRTWDGLIDDVGVWNRPITEEEVALIYNGGAGTSLKKPGIVWDFNDGLPEGSEVAGTAEHSEDEGVDDSGALVLTRNVASQMGGWLSPEIGTVSSFTIDFDIYIADGTTTQADGISMAISDDLEPVGAFGEEGKGSKLIVSFDNWDNGGGEAPAIDIFWAGERIATQAMGAQGASTLDTDGWWPVHIELTSGGDLTLLYNDELIHDGVNIANFAPIENARVAFGGRTGGANANQFIDNFRIVLDAGNVVSPFVASSTEPVTGPTIVDFGVLSGDASYEFFFKAIKAGASTAIAGNDAFALKLDQWNEQGVFGTTVFGVADNVFTPVEGKSVASVFDRDVHVVVVNDTAAGETRLYVDGDQVGVLSGNFELAGEGKVMGARIDANTDPMGEGSVMHKWVTYGSALTDEKIAGLADEVVPLSGLVDISQPNDAVVASSDNHPAGEHAGLSIDDDSSTKYLNFDGANDNPSGLIITTGGGVVSGLGLTSANDAPDRDPATFVLSGSNDGGATFDEIASGDVPAFGARFERQTVSFDNSTAYTTYELIFPTTAGASTCCMQIAEIELLGTPADVPEPLLPPELPWSVGRNDDGWPAGDGGGASASFVQEAGSNELPGDPASPEVAQQADDDYYWAGDYSTVIAGNGDYEPVGLVEVNEEAAERAFAGTDNDLRYHFNLPGSIQPTDQLTVSYDALNLHTDGQLDPRYGVEVYVNNVQVQSEVVIRPDQLGQTYDTEPFTVADVNAEVGLGYDNIITLKGVNYNAEGGGNWMGIDYVQLNQVVGGDAPTISVVNNGDGTVTLTFEGTLQSADSVNGPWSDVEGATSPLTLPAEQAAQFGRAKN